MKIMLSETVTHYHEVELNDELDIENILDVANSIKNNYDTGYEALEAILKEYQDKFGEAFSYEIKPNNCGAKCESIDYEYLIEE